MAHQNASTVITPLSYISLFKLFSLTSLLFIYPAKAVCLASNYGFVRIAVRCIPLLARNLYFVNTFAPCTKLKNSSQQLRKAVFLLIMFASEFKLYLASQLRVRPQILRLIFSKALISALGLSYFINLLTLRMSFECMANNDIHRYATYECMNVCIYVCMSACASSY